MTNLTQAVEINFKIPSDYQRQYFSVNHGATIALEKIAENFWYISLNFNIIFAAEMDISKKFLLGIAKKYGITKIIMIVKDDEYCEANGEDYYTNSSCLAYPEIQLGIYDDPELKLASFFHEIGHILVTDAFKERVKYEMMEIEKEAWRHGFLVAEKHGVIFTDQDKVYKWAEEQIKTYINYK